MAKKLHGGTHHEQGKRHGPPAPRVYAYHAGSGRPMGRVHAAPTLPQVNDQNYAGHKVKRKK